MVERGDPGLTLVGALAARIARDGGAALFVDYGPARPEPGSSLQALRDGKPADPLAEAGSADLTAHVDFAGLAAAFGCSDQSECEAGRSDLHRRGVLLGPDAEGERDAL